MLVHAEGALAGQAAKHKTLLIQYYSMLHHSEKLEKHKHPLMPKWSSLGLWAWQKEEEAAHSGL